MPRKKSPTRKDRPLKTQAGGDPVLPAVNPATDDYAAPPDSAPFPIVGIGASAGGLEACTSLLAAVPENPGMAFVVVQHLSPTHESLLAGILQRATKLPVRQVEDNTKVEPDHVYVIPPGKHLVLGKGLLHLGPRIEVRGQQRPIDHFMRSLAEEHGHKSIGVVLSGTANDGSLGIQEIKAAGGITFAQDATAEQPSMPRSAVATGAVDFVLPPDEIGRELGRIARHPYVSPALDEGALALNESSMNRILGILRHGTGVDFDGYKRNTLNRRITRRMVLHKLEKLPDYVRFLQNDNDEVEALYQDVLINVTSFFRNPDAYEALKTNVFPKLTENRSRHDPVRIWALGCSTGEEAYSIAMTFVEFAEHSGRHIPAQIFATDLNGAGIDRARAGVYPKGIVEDVSAERLRRFFVEVGDSYRVSKPVRDMCVFARQNVLADPPFSRLDLVACRNLLIYLDSSLQQRIIPMLHYALRGSGYLWLGGSETIGSYRELFDIVDTKHKIYAKRSGIAHPVAVPLAPSARWDPNRGATHAVPAMVRPAPGTDPQREADRMLLARYAPPSVVVSDDLDILQFRGDTSPFLMPAPGRATLNLLKMLREGLIVAVRGAITRARRENKVAREDGLRVRSNGGWRNVSVEIVPIKTGTPPVASFMVVFEESQASLEARTRQLYAEAQADMARVAPSAETDGKEVVRLKQELGATRDYLQSVIEQQEAANEELQSASEEVQSANEELQSINEELETSKEEIQSSNEELATVNDELQNRNLELSQTNNDLTNLVASVQIAIVMVGRDLRIRRFTPAAERLFNLIPGDVGRPLGDIKLNINMPDLDKVAVEVIETISIRELEIQDRHDRWYSLRMRPYRTLENVIDGAVIVLVDIDDLKKAEQALRESEERFEVLADSAPALIWLADKEGLRFVNRAFEDFVGSLESEVRKANLWRFVHPDDRAGFESDFQQAVKEKRPFEARARFRRSDGEHRWMKTVGTPRLSDGHLIGFVGGTFDITDMKEAEAALLELDRGKNEFLAVLAHELRNPLSGVRNASHLLSEASDQRVIGQAREIIDRQTGNMVRMIDDLLDVSRITHGKIRLQREAVDLVALVRRTVQATAHERDNTQQTITLSLPHEELWIDADPLRTDQVVANLLNNASKFTRAGGRIWLTVEREAGRRGEPATATIRVRDNGVGIDPAVLPRIFDLFVQGERSVSRSRAGMGLGLTLSKRLVDLHGGTIEAFSAGNALGSEFVVRIPTIAEPQAAREEQPERVATARRYRLLVVDDDRDAAESLRMMLALPGHEVATVHRGEEAVEKAAAFRADTILLDIGLPDMDGYDVARALRKDARTRDAMIIAVTGYGRREDVESAHAAGVDEHMTKPIDPDTLMAFVERGRKPADG